MRNLILFDTDEWRQLLPLTYTRPAAELRCGILRLREKWSLQLDAQASYVTQEYLTDKYPIRIEEDNFLVNGMVMPSDTLVRLVRQLDPGEALLLDDELIAARLERAQFDKLLNNDDIGDLRGYELDPTDVTIISKPWHLFEYNAAAIASDYQLLTRNRQSAPIPDHVIAICPEQIFIEPEATVLPCTLNATDGPIYIGKGSTIMEGAMVRGPFALCTGATVKMGTKIYGGTTIGPHCKAGGEISASVFLGYSNKSHDGYLGNSVIGEWCNLGAQTNVSNMKNTYQAVRLWNYGTSGFDTTGLQFCGLIMGDHTKTGINTMFNTGTVVGVASNIFGTGFPRNFIPSFSWGGTSGFKTYEFEKVIETATAVLARRNRELTPEEIVILRHIFEESAAFRSWEKTATPS
ncbi:MAG: GlmU family protein [Saprospiraceae bacterium]|nr:GlmU family protein [Saprospiraceae bacterium]